MSWLLEQLQHGLFLLPAFAVLAGVAIACALHLSQLDPLPPPLSPEQKAARAEQRIQRLQDQAIDEMQNYVHEAQMSRLANGIDHLIDHHLSIDDEADR